MVGQSTDGNTVTIAAPINFQFLQGVNLGGKRYFADADSERIDGTLHKVDLYLYEYEHFYED